MSSIYDRRKSGVNLILQNDDNDEEGDSLEYRRLERMALKGQSHPLLDIFRESTAGISKEGASRTSSGSSLNSLATNTVKPEGAMSYKQRSNQDPFFHTSKRFGRDSGSPPRTVTPSVSSASPTSPFNTDLTSGQFLPFTRSQSCGSIFDNSQPIIRNTQRSVHGGRHFTKIQPKKPLSDALSDIKESDVNGANQYSQKPNTIQPVSGSSDTYQKQSYSMAASIQTSHSSSRPRSKTLSSTSVHALHPYHRKNGGSPTDFHQTQFKKQVSAAYMDILDKFQSDIENESVSTKLNSRASIDYPKNYATGVVKTPINSFSSKYKSTTLPNSVCNTIPHENRLGSHRKYHSMVNLPGRGYNDKSHHRDMQTGKSKPKLVNLKQVRPNMRRAHSNSSIPSTVKPAGLPNLYPSLDTMTASLLPPIETNGGSVFDDLLGLNDLLAYTQNVDITPIAPIPIIDAFPIDAFFGSPESTTLSDEPLTLCSPVNYNTITSTAQEFDGKYGVLASDWGLVLDALPLDLDSRGLPGMEMTTCLST